MVHVTRFQSPLSKEAADAEKKAFMVVMVTMCCLGGGDFPRQHSQV